MLEIPAGDPYPVSPAPHWVVTQSEAAGKSRRELVVGPFFGYSRPSASELLNTRDSTNVSTITPSAHVKSAKEREQASEEERGREAKAGGAAKGAAAQESESARKTSAATTATTTTTEGESA